MKEEFNPQKENKFASISFLLGTISLIPVVPILLSIIHNFFVLSSPGTINQKLNLEHILIMTIMISPLFLIISIIGIILAKKGFKFNKKISIFGIIFCSIGLLITFFYLCLYLALIRGGI